MEEADLGLTQFAHNQNRTQGDDHLFVEFFMHPRQDKKATLEHGRPIYKDTEYVRIMVPGDKESIIERPAGMDDRQRFPRQFAAFQQNQQVILEGTPLTEWSTISGAQVKELEYFGIRTVEQLANLADSKLQGFMGGSLLKRRAQEYMEISADKAPLEAAALKVEQLEAENTALKESLASVTARLDALEQED